MNYVTPSQYESRTMVRQRLVQHQQANNSKLVQSRKSARMFFAISISSCNGLWRRRRDLIVECRATMRRLLTYARARLPTRSGRILVALLIASVMNQSVFGAACAPCDDDTEERPGQTS